MYGCRRLAGAIIPIGDPRSLGHADGRRQLTPGRQAAPCGPPQHLRWGDTHRRPWLLSTEPQPPCIHAKNISDRHVSGRVQSRTTLGKWTLRHGSLRAWRKCGRPCCGPGNTRPRQATGSKRVGLVVCCCVVAFSPAFCLPVLARKTVGWRSRPLQRRQQRQRQAGKEVEVRSRRLLGLRWHIAHAVFIWMTTSGHHALCCGANFMISACPAGR